MNAVEKKRISPHKSIGGQIVVPGDKSISHRAAMLAGICRGESKIRNFLLGQDCNATLRAMESLGVRYEVNRDVVTVHGIGAQLKQPGTVLDMGNSGTGMRLLSGILAGQKFSSELTGDESLLKRPMRRIQEPLQLMGARVELLGGANRPPVRIEGGLLKGIEYRLPVPSAQVKSCIMLASFFAEGSTLIIEPKVSRDHTERMLNALGANIEYDNLKIKIIGSGSLGPEFKARDWTVPGDFSSAAYWFAAAACSSGGEVKIENVGLNPGRSAMLDVLSRMGAQIDIGNLAGDDWEPTGTVKVTGDGLDATVVEGDEIPRLLDELPLVAICAAMADGQTVINNAGELRVKECDRIAALHQGLSRIGVMSHEFEDGLKIQGATSIKGGCEIDSYGDHRIAMAFAILTLFAEEPVVISNVGCVATSYPSFWRDLNGLCGHNVVEEVE